MASIIISARSIQASLFDVCRVSLEFLQSLQKNAKIFDWAVLVHMPLPKTASTFTEYIHTASVSYSTYKSSYSPVERIGIVWDANKPDGLCQHRHKEEESRTLQPTGVLLQQWKFQLIIGNTFLCVDDTKTERLGLLEPKLGNIHGLGCVQRVQGLKEVWRTFNHEEAVTPMFCVFSMLSSNTKESAIRTIDTDVFFLAVSQMQIIMQSEVWLTFGMGKLFRYHEPIHKNCLFPRSRE